MDAVTQVPAPVNEPVLQYAPGTPERAELQAKLAELQKEPLELTMTIGGEQRMGGGARFDVVQPHNHRSVLGTLAGAVYPRATLWAIPLVWLGAGLGPWLLADPGTHTLGASGLTHGLMFMIFMLGLLRRDRAAIAAGMIAFLFYGGMVLTVLPREAGVSWLLSNSEWLESVLACDDWS